MALTPAQLPQLKTELTTDPRGYGYAAALLVSDQTAADVINTVRDGTNVPPAIQVNKGTISTQELVEAVVQSEMPSNANQRDWLIMVASGARVRVDTGSTARAGLLAIFGSGTTTRTNLTNASQRLGSRAEELWGFGVVVTSGDVSLARALP